MLKGLDQTVLNQIEIKQYDFEYLKEYGNKKVVRLLTQCENDREVLYDLTIIDRELGVTLKHAYAESKGYRNWYVYLILVAPEG